MRRTERWMIAQADPAAAELAGKLRISPLIGQMLVNRGIHQPEAGLEFLAPRLSRLPKPAALCNATKAAQRIVEAIRGAQKIAIYGDYDVDGISTAILWHAIRRLGGEVEYYIPHRLEEGYGLNSEALAVLCDGGAKLIITVDCGITAVEQAKVACQRGVDLIITDHHEWHAAEGSEVGAQGSGKAGPSLNPNPRTPSPGLPECYAIVHPRLQGEAGAYPNPYLCGAGVAFKLAWAIGQAMSGGGRVSEEFKAFLVDATALAALATIADVVPLVGENRVLAHYGLMGLTRSRLVGLRALIASARLSDRKLDSYQVGFQLAPRLNACGRMGHAALAVEMLTRADEARAAQIATDLEQQNRARQALERKILEEALAQLRELKMDTDDQRAIVLGSPGWHPGVIGIVASRIVDRFNRPTIMVALTNGQGQGSGRSIAGFHLAKALGACAEHLEGYGGHEMAAGLRVSADRFEDFRRAFCRHARQTVPDELLVPELRIDAVAELRQVNEGLVKDFVRLGPFGHGNRRPMLCCRGVELAGPPRRCGRDGEHAQLLVRQGGVSLRAIAFKGGEWFERLGAVRQLDLAFEPILNEYQGRTTVELDVKDVRVAEL